MPFQKGHKLSKGRPKGSVSKYTTEIKDKLKCISDDILDTIDVNEMDISDKLKFLQLAC